MELISPECSVKMGFWTKYYIKMFIPFAALLTTKAISMLVLIFQKHMQRKDDIRIFDFILDRCIPLMLIFVVAMYTFLISASLSPFKCKFSNGQYVMFDNPSALCFDSEWNNHVPLGLLFSTLYGILVPCT